MYLKILIIAMTAVMYSAFAVPVDRITAESVAKNWLTSKSADKSYNSVSEYINFENAVHIFNFKDGGFVLVAADDASNPVLGYSSTGEFNNDPEKTNVNFWLGLYAKAIVEIRTNDLDNKETILEWDNILKNQISKSEGKAVLPLLTSTWNQSPIYNNYCPLDGGSLSVVGCVATAMSQIMYYHKYPATGSSSSSYTVPDLGVPLAVDYYISRYNWDLMPDALSSGSSDVAKHEVAQISYHAGVAVEMMYGSDASGAYSEDVPYALETYFKYSTSAVHNYRTSYNSTTWRTMLQDQLNRSLPVYYSGSEPTGGHAFVCDGFQDANFYHFNWGWGGSADGYFSIDNLNPGGYTFNDNQAVVKEIVPKTADLTLNPPLPDVQTYESTYKIDLSQHFYSASSDSIAYLVDPKSDIIGLDYIITGDTLTLSSLTNGTYKVIVTCSTKKDNSFDDFYINFCGNEVLAGFGNSYDFKSTAYLDAGNSSSLNSMDKVAFSTWVKFNTVGREQGIVSKSASTTSGWYLMLQSNNILKFFVKTDNGNTRRIYSLQTLTADKWYHIDVMFDGKDLYLYINGELENTKTYTAASDLSNDVDSNILLGNTHGIYLDGQLDETIVWNKPISVSQIRDIMGKRPQLPDPSIVAFWTMDEGFFDATYDMIGLHDGTFINNDLDNWQDSQAPQFFFMGTNSVLNAILLGEYDETAVYNITDSPALGTIDILYPHNGDFEYTPYTDATGIDTLKYSITSDKAVTPDKTVYISVKASNGIEENTAPAAFELFQNYPNPFNPVTQINFALADMSDVKLTVYNVSGQKVADLVKGIMKAGRHAVDFDGSKFNSGIYYYTLEAEGISVTKKMVLTK